MELGMIGILDFHSRNFFSNNLIRKGGCCRINANNNNILSSNNIFNGSTNRTSRWNKPTTATMCLGGISLVSRSRKRCSPKQLTQGTDYCGSLSFYFSFCLILLYCIFNFMVLDAPIGLLWMWKYDKYVFNKMLGGNIILRNYHSKFLWAFSEIIILFHYVNLSFFLVSCIKW